MHPSQRPNYQVFRNVVRDFGADNTGRLDASMAIQEAISAGASHGGPRRDTNQMGTTGQPAMVYIPGGTYLLRNSLQLYLGTVVVGDPSNPPVLKVAPGFAAASVVMAKDPSYGGTDNFFVGFKNVVIDSTDVFPGQALTLLDWTVSQATQLTNVLFKMPTGSAHVGLGTFSGPNSNLILNDLSFHGGQIGMNLAGQQWVLKNITFRDTATGVVAAAFDLVLLGCHWENNSFGVNAQSISGSLTVIDSSGVNVFTLIKTQDSSTAAHSIILENVRNQGATVVIGDSEALAGSDIPDTWIRGDLVRYPHQVNVNR